MDWLACVIVTLGADSPAPVRGRVIGRDGGTRGDLALVAGPISSREPRPEPFASLALIPIPDQLRTDPAGRLHLAGLIPGTHYGLSIQGFGTSLDGDLFTGLAVGAGEVRDLGDLAVPPRPIVPPR